MPSEARLEIFFEIYKIRALKLPQRVHFIEQSPNRQEKGGQGGHFAQKGGKKEEILKKRKKEELDTLNWS